MSVADVAARIERLAAGAAVVDACRKCAIGSQRRNSVYGEGDPFAQLLVVGEGPGETEDHLGRPFVGRAGELLDRMLLAIGLPRAAVYICNTVKCRPTLDDGSRLRNRAPDLEEMANCRPYLDQQIDIIRPRVILTLGAPASRAFLGPAFSITRQRGRWYVGPLGIPLIASFHPAYILRMTGGEQNAVKRLVWDDLKEVRAKLDEVPPAPDAPAPTQAGLFEG
jgi:uracil-DNA glycosylase family 4